MKIPHTHFSTASAKTKQLAASCMGTNSLVGAFHQQLRNASNKSNKSNKRKQGKKAKPVFAFSATALSVSMALAGYSLPAIFTPAYANGPEGGVVVGGSGAISKDDLTTTINQTSQNMAIDWDSYNLSANESVTYIQPNANSVSLNRILSSNGSVIAGKIDANGQVILVNPHGLIFTESSVLNVGSIVASGLDIQSSDFMNGDTIFSEVLDSEGIVINRGLINASLGGNVALIGKQVTNEGLIEANLGTVTNDSDSIGCYAA